MIDIIVCLKKCKKVFKVNVRCISKNIPKKAFVDLEKKKEQITELTRSETKK